MVNQPQLKKAYDVLNDPNYGMVSPFDAIKKIDPYGNEFWYARDLYIHLGYRSDYSGWQNFDNVVQRAMLMMANSGINPHDQFHGTTEINRPVQMPLSRGDGYQVKNLKDYILRKTACHFVTMCCANNKKEVADAYAYFSIMTQRQELTQMYLRIESELNHLKEQNTKLLDANKEQTSQMSELIDQNKKLLHENNILQSKVDYLHRQVGGVDNQLYITRTDIENNDQRLRNGLSKTIEELGIKQTH